MSSDVELKASGATSATAAGQGATPEIPTGKQTTLSLYVTAQEAYELWRADPERVKILDVRTPEEYAYVGHAEMARNIPFVFVENQWNADTYQPTNVPNPEFVSSAQRVFRDTDTILTTCRSGGRGAQAVNALANAGFRNVYNIVDGMEGDTVDDPDSVYHGKRMKNGWKNAGLPWTYQVSPALMWIPSRR